MFCGTAPAMTAVACCMTLTLSEGRGLGICCAMLGAAGETIPAGGAPRGVGGCTAASGAEVQVPSCGLDADKTCRAGDAERSPPPTGAVIDTDPGGGPKATWLERGVQGEFPLPADISLGAVATLGNRAEAPLAETIWGPMAVASEPMLLSPRSRPSCLACSKTLALYVVRSFKFCGTCWDSSLRMR